jgi:4-hydroxy-2-oxoheptanedioate aldolase
MFGPGDLAQDMGLELRSDSNALKEAWARVRGAAHAAGKLALAPHGYGLQGADIFLLGMDLLLLRKGAKEAIAQHREWAMAEAN